MENRTGITKDNTIQQTLSLRWKQGISRNKTTALLSDLQWTPTHLSFADSIARLQALYHLPPYIKRAAESTDTERYQTVYAQQDGSVAAPTAGLHFTPLYI